jgi:hypothetical protein
MNDLVAQNPQLHSLSYSIYKSPGYGPLLDILLDHPLQNLKRLEVQSRLTGSDFGALITALILRGRRQEKKRRALLENDSTLEQESEQELPHTLAEDLLQQQDLNSEIQPVLEESASEEQAGEPWMEETSSSESEGEGEEDEEEEEDDDEWEDDEDDEDQEDEDDEGQDDDGSESHGAPFTFTNEWRNWDGQERWLDWQYNMLDSETRAKLTILPNLDLEELIIRNTGPTNATKYLFDDFLRQCY